VVAQCRERAPPGKQQTVKKKAMVALVRKAFRLHPSDRRLLIAAVGLLACVRLALWLFPFQVVRNILATLSPGKRRDHAADPAYTRRVACAVERASRCVPFATCLPQALAAECLLRRDGYPTQLRIGVAKDLDGQFLAHAWIESDGSIVVGRLPNLSSYTVLKARASQLQ
jgi:hypothetical protein